MKLGPLPIKFSLWQYGQFIRDESVEVTVIDEDDTIVFHVVYGQGDDYIRIDDDEMQYITNWHTEKNMKGEFEILVSFDNGLSISKSIELVGK